MKIFGSILLFSLISFFGYNQSTYVPDDNFEQKLILLGLDSGPLDDYVNTNNIDTVTSLILFESGIEDLTGIEDFVSLKILNCSRNNLITINTSTLVSLERLACSENYNLTNLDLLNNAELTHLVAFIGSLPSINLICLSATFPKVFC